MSMSHINSIIQNTQNMGTSRPFFRPPRTLFHHCNLLVQGVSTLHCSYWTTLNAIKKLINTSHYDLTIDHAWREQLQGAASLGHRLSHLNRSSWCHHSHHWAHTCNMRRVVCFNAKTVLWKASQLYSARRVGLQLWHFCAVLPSGPTTTLRVSAHFTQQITLPAHSACHVAMHNALLQNVTSPPTAPHHQRSPCPTRQHITALSLAT